MKKLKFRRIFESIQQQSDLDYKLIKMLANERLSDAQSLLRLGADPNAETGNHSALSCAVKSLEAVKMLADAGVDLNKSNRKGENALNWAAERGNKEVFDWLVGQGVSPTHVCPILYSVCLSEKNKVENYEAFKECYRQADYEYISNIDWTPLMAAIHGGYSMSKDLTLALIRDGANVAQRNNKGETALHYVAKKARYEDDATIQSDYIPVAMVLIEHGADVNAMDDETRTPLMWCGRDAKPLANFLKSKGATRNAKFRKEHGAGRTITKHEANPNDNKLDPTASSLKKLSQLPTGATSGAIWSLGKRYFQVTQRKGDFLTFNEVSQPQGNEIDTTPIGKPFRKKFNTAMGKTYVKIDGYMAFPIR